MVMNAFDSIYPRNILQKLEIIHILYSLTSHAHISHILNLNWKGTRSHDSCIKQDIHLVL